MGMAWCKKNFTKCSEKYFDMNKKQCKDTLEIYKRFLVRMDKVSEFLKTAENASKSPQQSVGIDKSDIPDLAKGLKNNANSAPSSLLDALEQHYQSLEGKKGVTTPVSGSNLYIPAPVGFAAAINTISSNTPTINVSEEERQRILDEENARLQQLKKEQLGKSTADSPNQEQRMKELGQSPQPNPSATNPFATQTPNGTSDLFGSPTKSAAPQKASDDLLSLSGNPFVQNVQNVMAMQNATQAMSQTNSFAQWNSAPATSVPASSSMFTSDVDFEKVFPNQSSNTSADLLSHDEDAAGSLDPTLESLDPILPMTTTRSPTVTTYSGLASGGIFSVDDAEVDTDLSSLSAMTSSDVHGSGLLETSNLATLSSWGTGTSIFGAGGSLISDQGTPGLPQGRGSVRGNTAAFPGPPMPTSPALHQRSLTPTMNESAPGRLSPALISSDQSGFDAFGEVLKPTSNVGMNSATQEKLINKDLDSSLSQLAGNLNIKGSASQVKKQQHDWQPKGEQKKTGGQSWQGLPPNISSSTWTSPSYGQPMVNSQSNMTTQSTMINSQQPPMMAPVMGYNVQPMMQQPGMMGVRPMGMQPAMGMQQPIGMQPAMGMQQPMVFGMQPAMGNMMSQPRPPAQTNQDPFGAL
nr:clathrin coat assembly protein AP180-like isoform X2 [Crassostrea gigas]